ncbi:adenylate/guanylate cyclase domain-containing protein [Aurantiacibacter gilvus]|uniref:Adenylate/guanylate cyclase domain-containing protein n=1 Tax=Aurantiacibacter gilvus TaxID=3139141 RepID=A0ABU9IER8_9SPHN
MGEVEAISRFDDDKKGGNILQPGVFSHFADPATEARYIEASRALRTPFVRLYCIIFLAVALAYSLTNSVLVQPGQGPELPMLVGLSVVVAGLYIAATWWEEYFRKPMVDFAALMLLSLLVTHFNTLLSDQLMSMNQYSHAVFVINRLLLTAFAAVVLAGSPRLFMAWMFVDMVGWLSQLLPNIDNVAATSYAVLSYVSGMAIMLAINLAIGRTSRAAFALAEGFDHERRKNEALVLNMLPRAAVERIRSGNLVADSYADVSVIFIDLVGFSSLARRVSPGQLVELLNAFFRIADECAEKAGVEKVKTVGDCYLALAGGNIPTKNSADAAINFAREVISRIAELREECGVDAVSLRAGVHSGPVVGGVIGQTRMAYDYWGDTVNVAARLEALAPKNGLVVSEATYLRTRLKDGFGKPEEATLKGVGDTMVYSIEVEARAVEGEADEEAATAA